MISNRSVITACFAMLLFAVFARPVQAQAVVTPLNVLSSCSAISMDVMVSNCPMFDFHEIHIAYDNTKLSVASVINRTNNNIFTANGYSSSSLFSYAFDSSANTYVVGCSYAGTPGSWTVTSGRLFTIVFNAVGVGASPITVSYHNIRLGFTNLPSVATYNTTVTRGLGVSPKAFLQGPYSGGVMGTALQPFMPLLNPYYTSGPVSPWYYSGTESVLSIPANVVDWVLCELRTGTGSPTTVSRRAAFIKTDGTIVDTNGTCAVSFPGVAPGNYYLVIRHRNHLSIMSASALVLGLTNTSYDFTTAQSQAYVNVPPASPMVSLGGGVYGMFAGDADKNGTINYALDRGQVWNNRGNPGYLNADITCNAIVNVAIDGGYIWNNRGVQTQVP
jgi:hypothetical protein